MDIKKPIVEFPQTRLAAPGKDYSWIFVVVVIVLGLIYLYRRYEDKKQVQ